MALAKTTTSAAVATGDTVVNLTSATSVVAGRLILIDGEWMKVQQSYVSGTAVPVLRGINGSVQSAHVSGANAVHGDAADFANPAPQVAAAINAPTQRVRLLKSYSAAGAIDVPTPGTDLFAIINGTGALAMTLANPGKDNDGDILYVVGNGKAAHTVTYTAGLGNGGANLDVATFAAGGQQCMAFIAANEIWVPMPSVLAGTLTNITVTMS